MPALVLAALPWMMLAVSTNWIYSDSGLIDPWLYHGYFHRFPEFVSTFFVQTYYGTRLAWILPGYAAYHLLMPHAANLVLHLTFYYAATGALYRAAAILTSPPAALISVSAFATALPTIVAFGWDYVDGAVITYTAVAIWGVVEASRGARRAPLLMVAGAAAACIVHSNLGAGLIGPTIVTAYWCTHPHKRWADLGLFIAGGLIITVIFGAFSALVGGPFLFFMPSWRWATASLGTQPFIPVPPLKWPGSARFVIPLVGMSAAAGAFARRRSPATSAALFMCLWLVAGFAAYDWTFSAGLLQTQYYVSWFLPLASFGIAAALAPAGLSLTAAVMVSLGIAVLQVSALAGLPQLIHRAVLNHLGTALPAVEIAAVGATLLIVLAVSSRSRRSVSVLIIAAAIVVGDFVVVPNLGYGVSTYGRSQFDAVQQTLAFIRAHVPNTSQPLFWIAGRSGKHSYYVSLASTHLYLYSLISTRYPVLHDPTGEAGTDVERGDYVVVLADTPLDPGAVNREFERINLRATVEASAPVVTTDASFLLTLLRVD